MKGKKKEQKKKGKGIKILGWIFFFFYYFQVLNIFIIILIEKLQQEENISRNSQERKSAICWHRIQECSPLSPSFISVHDSLHKSREPPCLLIISSVLTTVEARSKPFKGEEGWKRGREKKRKEGVKLLFCLHSILQGIFSFWVTSTIKPAPRD